MADLDASLYPIKAILILDQDGKRILGKYYDKEVFLIPEAAFENNLFEKTKANAEITLLNGLICVYKSGVDLLFYVIGSDQENELMLQSVLTCLYDAFATVLRKNVEKKALFDHLDTAFLILDEICDDGVILETDARAVVARCAVKPDGVWGRRISQIGMSLNRVVNSDGARNNPYNGMNKATVLQEVQSSSNETTVNTRKCRRILCELLYLLQHGETIEEGEAADAFGAITKLLQTEDVTLRMLVCLAIKELSNISSDVMIVASRLTNDMTGSEDIYRPSTIRALCRILTEPEMPEAIEQSMKQAIVDKVPSVSSAALVSSLHMFKRRPEIVRRWENEVQKAVSFDNDMVQFHALCLLYKIRSNERSAIMNIVKESVKSKPSSPLAICYLIRIASKLVEDDESFDRIAFKYIKSFLPNTHEMVICEAASAIVRLSYISSDEIPSAVNFLRPFMSSSKPALRFAAVRTLNKISINYPQAVMSCNVDLAQLIADQNHHAFTTMAMFTFLKKIEREIQQIREGGELTRLDVRLLSQGQTDMHNSIRRLAEEVGRLVGAVERMAGPQPADPPLFPEITNSPMERERLPERATNRILSHSSAAISKMLTKSNPFQDRDISLPSSPQIPITQEATIHRSCLSGVVAQL